MKLSKNEKIQRTIMMEGFMAEGGALFSNVNSGMTVAVRPVCGSASRFCEVSLAFCDFAEDSFNRKRGEFVALQKWEHGEFVRVPMFGNVEHNPSDIASMFFEMFGE